MAQTTQRFDIDNQQLSLVGNDLSISKGNTLTLPFANYLPLSGGTLTGTTGNGFLGFSLQSSAPSTPLSGFRLFANSTNALSWKGVNGFVRTFDGTTNTADRTYTLQNLSGTIPLLEAPQTWTGANTFGGSDNTTNFIATSNSKYFGINPANNLLRSSHGWRFDVNSAITQTQAIQIFSNRNVVLQDGGTFTDAGYRLDVNGTGRFQGNVMLQNTGNDEILEIRSDLSPFTRYNRLTSGSTRSYRLGVGIDASTSFQLYDETSSSYKFTVLANGNFGIGTTAPISKLHVSNGNIETDNSANGLILKSPDGTRYLIKVANGGTLTATAL